MKPMLRRAGITTLPGTTPSTDQYGELIPEINRMMSGFNLDGHKIFTTRIDRYALTPNQTTYFIGPTGDFVADRPIRIIRANLVLTASFPEIFLPLHLMDDIEWAALSIEELPAAYPWSLYNDGDYPDSQLYLYGYPTQTNDLQLFTPQQLPQFVAATDSVVLPPGYEDLMVTQGALRVRALYPYDCRLNALQAQELRMDAARALQTVRIANAECPDYLSEAAALGGNSGNPGNFRAEFEKFGGNL